MKTITLILIALACFLIVTESKNRSQKKHRQLETPVLRSATPVDTKPVHVNEMIIGNPNNMVKDRHFLWKDFQKRNFERPYMHGVVGPQWDVPLAENNRGYKHIASPMPQPELVRRILPSDFPPRSYSPTSFDMPMRKDVVQADIPMATIRTVEENIDPRFPPKRLVPKITGTLYHGTKSVDPRVVHGLPSFLQKKMKKLRNHHRNYPSQLAQLDRAEGLAHARNAEGRATHALYSITNNPVENNNLILGVEMINRFEHPDIKLHQHNAALKERLARMRNTPAGVRAAHTFRKLPIGHI